MAARRPFWKVRRWKSIGFCLWPPSTCIWNLKLKFQRKLELCSGNHVVYRQTDGRTDKVNPVYPPSNFVGRGYKKKTLDTKTQVGNSKPLICAVCFVVIAKQVEDNRRSRYPLERGTYLKIGMPWCQNTDGAPTILFFTFVVIAQLLSPIWLAKLENIVPNTLIYI